MKTCGEDATVEIFMSMTAIDLFLSSTIQDDDILRNNMQAEVGSLQPYSGGKSVTQLCKNNRIKPKGSIVTSGAHLSIKINSDSSPKNSCYRNRLENPVNERFVTPDYKPTAMSQINSSAKSKLKK